MLFSNCKPVRGAKRSTICDLQRNDVKIIPNDLANILLKYNGMSISDVKKRYETEYYSTIDEYFEFLLECEYIFFTDNPDLYAKMNLNWHESSHISNAVIDRDELSKYNLYEVFDQLEELNCKYIELRFYLNISLPEVEKLIQYIDFKESIITSIDILLPENDSLSYLEDVINKYNRIASFKIYKASKNEFIPPKNKNKAYVIYSKNNIKNSTYCGVISKDFFVANTALFSEGVNSNTCLNRKLGIDTKGNIKNCPSMPETYGNVKDTRLEECVNILDFKNVTKDDIEICKDCEFRYICTDCRAYTEGKEFNNEGLDLSKPLKCGYNPYTNEWSEWSKITSKKNAMEKYGISK